MKAKTEAKSLTTRRVPSVSLISYSKFTIKTNLASYMFLGSNPQEPKLEPIPKIIVPKGVRRNGWSWPPHPQQIITYVVYFYDFGTFYFINMTTLSVWPALAVTLSIVYFIISMIVLVYAVIATISDPSDPTIYEQRLAEARG